MRIVGWIAIFAAFSLLTACSSNKGGKYFEDDGPPGVFSLSKMDMRDATPVVEKPIAATNKPYTVMGSVTIPSPATNRWSRLATALGTVKSSTARRLLREKSMTCTK